MPEIRRAVTSLDELLAEVTDRVPLESNGKSGALLESCRIGDRGYVLKHLADDADWSLRAAGVPGGAVVELWRRGILDDLPSCLFQPIIGIGQDPAEPGFSLLLMEDVGEHLVPDDGAVLPLDQQERFLDHMAALHAAFWETGRDIDVVTPERRYTELSPQMAEVEEALGSTHLVPQLVAKGWPLLAEVAPAAAAVVVPLVREPGPLVAALATTPQTFVHGNWKLDNLGTAPDGRTVVLDWELPGRGVGLSDLAWFLAINCRRLATSKEDAVAGYRDALERYGVSTDRWWQRQLDLALLGALVQFGWEKALGGYDDELAWWEDRALRAVPLL